VDKNSWAAPADVITLPADVSQGLPAAASTSDAWYVLSFDADANQTTARLDRSEHDTLKFQPDRDIATRNVGIQDIYLHGSYQVRFANDLVNVGDYVGLAGATSSLAAAIVLPRNDL
jgi:hypothetical protein